ncbi:MAG: MarR family transcriptional regulator [Acidobacteriales bacterium]|nr:MarR family transcriptional regulator [Terriglobales bacterium]
MRAPKAITSGRLSHKGDESHLFREITRTHQVLMAGFSREVGMPPSRFALMRLLVTAEKDVGVMDLARQLGINPAAVTRQVKEMEGDGLIRRRADPRDGRRSHVRLSPKGFRVFEDLHDRTHEIERALSSVLSSSDVEVAVKVLSKLRSFLEEQL